MTFDDPLRLLVLLIVLLLGLVFAAGAIARPRIKVSEPQSNATVILLVDVSGSMNSTDVKPTRLDAAVRAMSGFLDKLPSQFKVGLVAFSTELEPLVSPTTNRDLVKQAIGLLEPEAGTALGDGIAAALHILTSSLKDDGYVREPGKPVPGTIVLLSDGAQNRGVLQPVQAALLAKKDGIRIYPVSLGTPDGTVSYGVGAFVQRVRVPPDPQTMIEIAQITSGKSYTARTASSALNAYRTLGSHVSRTPRRLPIASWFAAVAAALLLGAVGAGALFSSRLP